MHIFRTMKKTAYSVSLWQLWVVLCLCLMVGCHLLPADDLLEFYCRICSLMSPVQVFQVMTACYICQFTFCCLLWTKVHKIFHTSKAHQYRVYCESLTGVTGVPRLQPYRRQA